MTRARVSIVCDMKSVCKDRKQPKKGVNLVDYKANQVMGNFAQYEIYLLFEVITQ